MIALGIFAVVALVKVYTGHLSGSIHPAWSWFNPLDIGGFGALTDGLLLAIFIYWGWDTAVSVNEETTDAKRTPGRAAVVSTFLLLGIYLVVSTAAQAVHGVGFLNNHADDILSALGKDVLPWHLDKLLIIAVLTSASASTQTTILPTTRATLSMAAHGAIPKHFARIHPRFLTPGVSTIWMCIVSIACFVTLNSVSSNILGDSVTATGFGIAFYYGLTGFACFWYFRRELTKSLRNLVYVGLLPLIGGLILFTLLAYDIYQQTDPSFSNVGHAWLGVGPPVAIGMIGLAVGIVLMLAQRLVAPDPFFRWKTETADPGVLEAPTQAVANA